MIVAYGSKERDKEETVSVEQENDMNDLASYLSQMGNAEYLMMLMAQAYTDGLHQGYKMSPGEKEAG